MSEKVRAFNLTTGNALTSAGATTPSAHTGTGIATGGCALIGAPTLISSTFSGSSTQALTPMPLAGGVGGGELLISAGSGGGGAGATAAGGSSDTESQSEYATGALTTQLNFHLLPTDVGAGAVLLGDANSIMNSSQISSNSNDSMQLSSSIAAASGAVCAVKAGSNGKHLAAQSVAGKSCRFPKLEECAHFHYERVQLGPLSVRLMDDKSELLSSSIASQSIGGDIDNSQGANGPSNMATSNTGPASFRSFSPSTCWFIIKVFPHRCDSFLIKRSFDNMQMLDEMLHRCVYDRKISGLKKLHELEFKSEEDVEYAVAKYLERFSKIASDSLTCGTILTWLQLDNKGRRLPLADSDTMRSINTPAVGAAYGVRRYQAQATDEISIEVGDMISVIDMPSPAESIWWRGKKSHMQKSHYEVGFFPQACVATIGDKVPRNCRMPPPLVGQLDVSPTKPVLRKHGKLIAFFRSFILSRPSRRRLKQSGIYRERVFSCDLSEHLLNSGQEIPMVLKCCAEFIEEYGIIDGIYRLSGITSNIQKLRRAFDEERIPDLGNPEMKQDIHAVSSLLKMYFRELPNPLCTYQLYDNFVEAIQEKSESTERLRLMKETVLKLPPPHYRTLKYLSEHLNKISQHSARTGMTDKNLAIVWAPNLLRSPALESGGVAALRGVGVQAVVTEYLIRNCHHIFDALEDPNARLSYIATAGAVPAAGVELRMDSLTDCESLLVEQREHDQSLTFTERPKSLGAGGPKLISLEEAQERHSRLDNFDIKQTMPISVVASNAANISSYIEVGGGPSSLPDKYHTVLSVPRNWQKRKTHSWKSLFTRNQRTVSAGGAALESKMSAAGVADSDILPPHHKEATQVTFAESDAIITSTGKATGKSMLKQEKTKSIELFETTRSLGGGELGKPMEVCMRSNSIDSLRTAGHSRSVSHDSYFDLLQSPQRGHMTTCPSRELSELGLNFDREEPEMRIFSESESLVSSPRVGKENIPPSSGATSRRILRARPEEFSSQTNSVNPSPKKQPRLNLLLSPSAASGATHNWPPQQQQQQQPQKLNAADTAELCHEHNHLSSDESCCKRYKLEDQLSDIQFIDCSTPEHQIANPQTLYTSVQVHAPPKSALSKSSLYSSTESAGKLQEAVATKTTNSGAFEKKYSQTGKLSDCSSTTCSPSLAQINTRYSYPTVQLGAKRKDQECAAAANAIKERFSYPGTSATNERCLSAKERTKMQMEEEARAKSLYGQKDLDAAYNAMHARVVSFNAAPLHAAKQTAQHMPKALPDLLRPRNRNSYCGNNEQINSLLLRNSSSELAKDAKSDMERSKLSVTPSSPVQSPRYSLLVGETSSENSSAVTTPQYDLDPLMVASAMSGLSGVSGTSSNLQQQLLLGLDAASSSYLGTSHESLGSNLTSHSPHHMTLEKRDMHALKRELSLDLQPLTSTNMAIDQIDAIGGATLPAKLQLQQQQLQQLPSPNNSNFTDNTSQSVTPSEFGYQHLQRQSSMHSLIETEENSPTAYEDYENTPSNLVSPLSGAHKLPPVSPIKSTISITYNLKSPKEEAPPKPLRDRSKAKTLLETSFDENTVYEQVKFFRNSVTEVNQMLDDGRKSTLETLEKLKTLKQTNNEQEIGEVMLNASKQKEELSNSDICLKRQAKQQKTANVPPAKAAVENADIYMLESQYDSLEEDAYAEKEKLLYENVELRKPQSVYENVLGEELKQTHQVMVQLAADKVAPEVPEKYELDSLDSVQAAAAAAVNEEAQLPELSVARRSPSNFSVKELATKFESSPVEQASPFDFSLRSSIRKPVNASVADLKSSRSSLTEEKEQHLQPTQMQPQQQQSVEAPATSLKQKQLTKSQQITRSLDENAFVREFGAKHLHDLAARSIQQLPELAEVCNRRKSFDFTRPKTLNPPKRLPGMPITEEMCLKSSSSSEQSPTSLKADSFKEQRYFKHAPPPSPLDSHANNAHSSIEHDCESSELKITPTTENRISLIQHNVAASAVVGATAPVNACSASTADLSNSNLNLYNSGLKVLSGVKLDRERIDKIKEERRQQLTQKYRGDNSFKSKSKTDLNSTGKEDDKFSNSESLRIKSKSRGDMDNLKEWSARSGSIHAGSESTLNASSIYSTQQRVRSISDEKNQNCETSANANGITTVNHTNNITAAATAKTINSNNSNTISNLAHTPLQELTIVSAELPPKRASVPQEEFSARATAQKFERKCLDYANGGNSLTGAAAATRERRTEASIGNSSLLSASRNSLTSTREKISPQFSIRDVTAMFESRSQNQQ